MKTLILRFSSSLLALSAIADPQAAWAGCFSTETSGNGAIGEGYRVCVGTGGVTKFGHDAGLQEAGFGPPTINQPNGPNPFPLTVTRNTTDGSSEREHRSYSVSVSNLPGGTQATPAIAQNPQSTAPADANTGVGAGPDAGAHTIAVDIPADAINAKKYGSLQEAANAANGKNLYIPPGTYPGGLTIKGPVRVIAYGVTLKPAGGEKDRKRRRSLRAMKKKETLLSLSSPVSVEGIALDGNGTGVAGINITGNGVKVSNCVITNIKHNQNDGSITIQNAQNVVVDHCTITNNGMDGINLAFSSNSWLTNNKIANNGRHGIQWWGGGADVNQSPGGVTDLTVTGNVVMNSGGGGIWGSVGWRVTANHNTIDTCGDVCLDFEGGKDDVVIYNSVHNGKNGGMTTFYAAQNIEFSHNVVAEDQEFGPGYKSYGNGVSQNIRVLNNTITTNGSDGIFLMKGTFTGGTITDNDITLKGGGKGIHDEGNTGNNISNNTIH